MKKDLEKITNDQMLELIRKDRPDQVIHSVEKFWKNSLSFYTVSVDMEGLFLKTLVKHIHIDLPYPRSEYAKLDGKLQMEFGWGEIK